MDNDDKTLLRLQFILWIRSGGQNMVAWEKIQISNKTDPIDTKLVLLDVIEYLAREVLEKMQTITTCLYKLS